MKKLLLATFLSIICSGLFAQWYSQTSGTYQNLRSVYFTDNLNGWIVGSNGVMLHTINGGTNWDMQISSEDENLTDVFFIDSIHGWITGHIPQPYIDDATRQIDLLGEYTLFGDPIGMFEVRYPSTDIKVRVK